MIQNFAILSGSFNPLHDGHLQMRRVAERRLRRSVHFELSITNVEKPALTPEEIERRLAQFVDTTCWVTHAPTFLEKARLFPGATFVVGADTIVRIGDSQFYRSQPGKLTGAITEIKSLDCRFLVFGRTISDRFAELPALDVLPELAAICDWISERDFRVDISSTQLRET